MPSRPELLDYIIEKVTTAILTLMKHEGSLRSGTTAAHIELQFTPIDPGVPESIQERLTALKSKKIDELRDDELGDFAARLLVVGMEILELRGAIDGPKVK